MGKKSKILYYSVLFVNLGCFVLDLIPGINFSFFRISFAVSLFLSGLLLINRSLKLKLDSSMFIGVILMCFGILNGLQYFGIVFDLTWVTTKHLIPFYLFAVALASLVTSLYFKDKLQRKIFVLFLGFSLITLLFSLDLLRLLVYVSLMIAWFVVYFIANLVIFKKRSR